MTEKVSNPWGRWLVVFVLISLGSSALTGLDQAMHDRQPLLAFIGYWISQVAFIVLPGAIVGGIVSAATSKSALGVKVMIAINCIVIALLIFGAVVKVRS